MKKPFLAKQYRPSRLSQTFPRQPPPQTHRCSLALCKSIRNAGWCGSPARRWTLRRWSLIFCSCWPAGQGRCSLPARSMRPLQRTPLTPVGRGSPAWSTSSGASWGLASSKQCGATATNSLPQAPHQNKASAQRIFFRCALLLFLTPVMRLRHIRLLLVFAVFLRDLSRLLQALLTVINRLIAYRIQQYALQMLKF